ncbi:TetR/AcrR family transcriptional regulator [Aeromicrobium sp. YIM 150415]|uniref:TetR/AcrR family transcriptional regulator n=1 Tax=Aeromicrobium sp. YIM 150415 TaxID=2803912 RepID=UPI0019641850|nr:TetR/AcrR family transcriptional regulator [Aeromicrobium sp. YIM 150415]MBM9465225.1 TetR/AcrR family transcriptional regulator [Aeromicrobium sp. YIM 150415]
MSTPRQRAREQTMRDIVRIGREHLAAAGPTALSLRAIARDLGVVSSAVYRYVASRDELLTLLIVDAYDELGDAVEAGVAASGEDPRERFMAAARAVRSWAIAEPSRYALVFGTPVPGYEAPGERTTGPGTRVIVALLRLFDDAARTGRFAAAALTIDPDLGADLSRIREEYGSPLEDAQLVAATIAWTGIFGAVSFEVFGQYGTDTFAAPSALFEAQMEVLAAGTGLS